MSLSRSFIIYTLSSVLASALPLAMLPALTHHLSAAEYGMVATMTTLMAFCTPPLTWGAPSLVAIEHGKQDADRFCAILSSTLVIPLISLVVLSSLVWIVAPWIAPRFEVPVEWFRAAPLIASLSVLPLVMTTLLRMRNAPVQFGLVEIGTAVLNVALSLLFVVVLKWHWEGRMFGHIVASALIALVALAWLMHKGLLTRAFERNALRDNFKFGLGLLPHDIGNQVIRLSDRLFLVAMVGLSGAGLYAVAAQVSSVALVMLSAFNRAWAPYLFPRLQNPSEETRRSIVRNSYAVMAGFAAFLVLFNLGVPLLYRWFIDPKFHASIEYVRWMSLGYFFTAIYLTYVDYIFYVKKTYLLSMITMINLTLNLTLNYLLIKQFGTVGASMAFATTMFVVMCLAFLLSNRVYPMPWFPWMRARRAA
jgi:O-antigen/teichoic acid export membrane protein